MGWQGQASLIEVAHRVFPIQGLYIYVSDNQFALGKYPVNRWKFIKIFRESEKFPWSKPELSLIEIAI